MHGSYSSGLGTTRMSCAAGVSGTQEKKGVHVW